MWADIGLKRKKKKLFIIAITDNLSLNSIIRDCLERKICFYKMSYMFFYSERPGTLAARKFEDDIPLEVKKRRLSDVIRVQNAISLKLNQKDIGKVFKVLIEGENLFSHRFSNLKIDLKTPKSLN